MTYPTVESNNRRHRFFLEKSIHKSIDTLYNNQEKMTDYTYVLYGHLYKRLHPLFRYLGKKICLIHATEMRFGIVKNFFFEFTETGPFFLKFSYKSENSFQDAETILVEYTHSLYEFPCFNSSSASNFPNIDTVIDKAALVIKCMKKHAKKYRRYFRKKVAVPRSLFTGKNVSQNDKLVLARLFRITTTQKVNYNVILDKQQSSEVVLFEDQFQLYIYDAGIIKFPLYKFEVVRYFETPTDVKSVSWIGVCQFCVFKETYLTEYYKGFYVHLGKYVNFESLDNHLQSDRTIDLEDIVTHQLGVPSSSKDVKIISFCICKNNCDQDCVNVQLDIPPHMSMIAIESDQLGQAVTNSKINPVGKFILDGINDDNDIHPSVD